MLEVHRESGGFAPPAQLNVFDFLFNRGEIHISDSAAYFTGALLLPYALSPIPYPISLLLPSVICPLLAPWNSRQ